jgi:hypothetical protein
MHLNLSEIECLLSQRPGILPGLEAKTNQPDRIVTVSEPCASIRPKLPFPPFGGRLDIQLATSEPKKIGSSVHPGPSPSSED